MNLDAIVSALKIDEGWRAQLYDDATGALLGPGSTIEGSPTVGYGFNFGRGGDELTPAEGTYLLTNRAIRAAQWASDLIPNWHALDDVRQGVCTNMAYNLGKSGLSKFIKFLGYVNARDFLAAAKEMEDSAWYTQVGPRARRLQKEMRTGVIA